MSDPRHSQALGGTHHVERLAELCADVASVAPESVDAAWQRMNQLTKPVGSLGRLESVAVQVAAIQRTVRPAVSRPRLIVAIGDHGVVAQGVAAYPSEVTRVMADVIGKRLSAVCQLADAAGVEVRAYDVGLAGEDSLIEGVSLVRVAAGTADMTQGPAMSRDEVALAVLVGVDAAFEAVECGVDLLAIGEMGIGNSTAAAALTSHFTGADPSLTVGAGAGSDESQLMRKVDAVRRALVTNAPSHDDPLGALGAIGGLEIAMMAGVVLGAAARGVPVISDGYIAGSAVLAVAALCPNALDYVIYSHRSAEPGHDYMYAHLGAQPLLELDLRLGEGTGAALAIPLVVGACRVMANMLTFEEAGIG